MKEDENMIDLHTHTTYSDGTDSVKELLEKANNLDIDVLSITDHDTCNSYLEMEDLDVEKYYKGKIIVGCEFSASFGDRLIEILGYGFDYNKIAKYLEDNFSIEKQKEISLITFNRFIEKVNKLGLIYKIDKNTYVSPVKRYYELIKYPENKEIINEDIWDSFSDFYRKGLTNRNSVLFLNKAELIPSVNEIINIIHESGGIAFLAHPYQYKYDDTKEFLDKIYNETNLDGIECYYTTFSKKQTDYLVNFATQRNLLVSGGSDYHALNKKNHDLGIGRGNLNIDKNILNNWNINFYK